MAIDTDLQPSDEADERQIELAAEAGEAYLEAADYMIEEVAQTGDRTTEGDFVVGIAIEKAEGMYRLEQGDLHWVPPSDGENAHLEVLVASAADGRFVPNLNVRAELHGDDGIVGPVEIPFVWHPGLYHYGVNLELPGTGTYDVDVHVDPATFPRHDETNGDRFGDGAEVRFEDVRIETGAG